MALCVSFASITTKFSRFCNIVAHINTLFPLWPNIPVHEYTTPHLSTHQPMDMRCFHPLAIRNNAAVDICVKFLHRYMLSVLLDTHPGMELISHMGTFCLTAKLLSKVETLFYFPTSNVPRFQFLQTLSTLVQHLLFSLFFFLTIAILLGMKWYLIVSLICISLITNNVEQLFMYLFGHCISSLEKYLFKFLSILKLDSTVIRSTTLELCTALRI